MNSDSTAFSQNQIETLRILARVLSSFSILGLFFVLILFWFFKQIRSFALELVVGLCFSNIVFNLTNYFPMDQDKDSNTPTGWCVAQAVTSSIFDFSSMIWTTMIGYTAYISVARQDHIDRNKIRYKISFFLFAYVLPSILGLM